jgi:hypothetical protein
MQAQASGAQQAQPDLNLQSCLCRTPAISKSTELQPQGQPSFVVGQPFLLPGRHPRTTPQDDTPSRHRHFDQSGSRICEPPSGVIRVSTSTFNQQTPGLVFCLSWSSIPKGNPLSPSQTSACTSHPTQTRSPSITIHHLPLDASPSTFYSLRIFDALAHLANPIAVTKRTLCAATNPRPHLIQSPELFAQQLTQLPLTEVSTLLDQKIPGNHAWH